MLRLTAVVALFPDLQEAELLGWIERGWVRAERQDPDWVFQDIDVARVRLIHDFRRAMDVPEETMPLVLSLLDQVYGLRAQMRAIARAVERQPEDVRAAILAALRG
jgi:chaperone modulatory protein CbpM